MRKQAFAIIIIFLFAKLLPAQICLNNGQTPVSAIILCGSASHYQDNIPVCGSLTIPVPCNSPSPYQNTNPLWFRLVCFSSGTLGFIITPDDPVDNFDWQLFDISGRNNEDVFTDPSIFIACNWSPAPGATGADANGMNSTVCAEASQELFCKMPSITRGHEYLLLVSHRSNSESGFQISVEGGTASVTDPAEPAIFNAKISCDGSQVFVILNKKMACTTIAGDGSDFSIDGAVAIISATAAYCNTETESNVVILSLSNPIFSGNHTLSIQTGTDGNTIRDRCNRYISPGDHVPIIPVTMDSALPDSARPSKCGPASLKLFFKKPVQCNSIAMNGSDFIITGPQGVTVSNVTMNCNTINPSAITTSEIELHFSSPVITGGVYQIMLTTGSDGSTIADECGGLLPAGSSIPFIVKPPVSALFTYRLPASCKQDTLYLFHNANNGVNNWNWQIDNIPFSNLANPVNIHPLPGDHSVRLIVSNGICSDTISKIIKLNDKIVAAFESPAIICPEDTVSIINRSKGGADQWKWNFGNGITSQQEMPPAFHYPVTTRESFYTIKLIAINTTNNCRDSAVKKINVLSSCYIAVPSAFTPNGDGLNDHLQALNALKADNLLFRVFNRTGQLIFETKDWTRKWDGRIKGVLQQTGVYAWDLSFTQPGTGEKIYMKGTTLLIR